jgi:hypothetical protein
LITLTILGEEFKPCSSSLCSFLQPPVTSSLIGSNILLSTLFSNTLNLCSFLNVRDQVSHPYKTTGKIIVLQLCKITDEKVIQFQKSCGKACNEKTKQYLTVKQCRNCTRNKILSRRDFEVDGTRTFVQYIRIYENSKEYTQTVKKRKTEI